MRVRKPHNPAEATERKLEIARLNRLGAEVNLDDRTGKILSARKLNVFAMLLAAKPRPAISQNQHDAAMRLASAWAAWRHVDGGGGKSDKVDCSGVSGPQTKTHITDAMIKGRSEVEWALKQLGPLDRDLIGRLVEEYVMMDRPTPYREVVEQLTGEDREERQPTIVRCALENLRRVYEEAPTTSSRQEMA